MIPELPGPSYRAQLLAAGYTDGELRRLRLKGDIVTIRRGVYLPAPDPRMDEAMARHSLLVAAVHPSLGPGSVVSHASAAVLLDLPLWAVPLGRIHVTRAQRTGGRIGGTVHLHTAPLDDDELVEVGGVVVTSPARTVLDLARTLPFEAAVVVADGALRLGSAGPADLAVALRRASGWPGSPSARRAVACADGASESVGESRSRVALRRAGFPTPTLQWEVRRSGTLVGRVDFGWPELRAVGEFDGRMKYGRLLEPGQDPGEVVFEEKLREDLLRAEGLEVARWTWDDLARFDAAADRIRRALRRRA